jgi:hypothetical protein
MATNPLADPLAKALNEGRACIDRWTLFDRVLEAAFADNELAVLVTKFQNVRAGSGYPPWTLANDYVELAAQSLVDSVLARMGLRTRFAGRVWCTLVRM